MGDINLNCCDVAYIILENEMKMQIIIGEDEEIEIEVNNYYEVDGIIYEVIEIEYGDNGEILIDTIKISAEKLNVK